MTNELVVALMVAFVFGTLMAGFPVAFTLAGSSILFGLVGWMAGLFDLTFFAVLPNRIYGIMINQVLLAIPLFIFMGVMLERSRVAEELLDTMGVLFGRVRGGLGISVAIVGAMLAASTGIVGATVVTMGLVALPTMLKRGYDPALSTGIIAASGTLGQIIPPSIVLVVLGDQISTAYQEAQRSLGNWSPDPVSVGDLFAGALIPGFVLVGLYITYVAVLAFFKPSVGPVVPREEMVDDGGSLLPRLVQALLAPAVLIISVLGSILAGVATPTEAAALGALGATMLGGYRLAPDRKLPVLAALVGLATLITLVSTVDMRVSRLGGTLVERAAIWVAVVACALVAWGLIVCLWRTYANGTLAAVNQQTIRITAMVFAIVICAQLFSLVFLGLGGDEMVGDILRSLPGGTFGAMVTVLAVIFVLGFFLDVLEIAFVVVPIVAPILLSMGLDPVWLGIMIAVNLQTSYLTPPFGFALFYLRGVAPPEISTGTIYRGVVPFVLIQLLMLAILALFPSLATWLPSVVFS
ncbi:TRAP transporter large permease subunit [Ahrensia sp. R2A130]|uniref:TRAP transporter large permease n=1 Tax=Ahrensia sp. R2A130 TaxID=744979 RepID=UPI0001E0F129|nr:TRAP transporter large permease subunit [Ahrensia sp. R2A130]EFL87511.1 trap dicarboxylate transporter, dctm subunit [Ahrensia sp. R2A130]